MQATIPTAVLSPPPPAAAPVVLHHVLRQLLRNDDECRHPQPHTGPPLRPRSQGNPPHPRGLGGDPGACQQATGRKGPPKFLNTRCEFLRTVKVRGELLCTQGGKGYSPAADSLEAEARPHPPGVVRRGPSPMTSSSVCTAIFAFMLPSGATMRH